MTEYEYIYYKEDDGKIRFCEDDDDIKYAKNVEVKYIIKIPIDLEEDGLSLTVPEEIDGLPVGMANIVVVPPLDHPVSKLEDPLIKYLYIPSTVRHISIETIKMDGVDLLSACQVEISPANPYLCIYENGIYNKEMTELYYIFLTEECVGGHFEVPAGVKRIKSGAGRMLKGLRRLTIPESVEVIEGKAFEYCFDLEYADIGAQNIGQRAFCSCNSLKEVNLRNGLQKIEDHAFAYSDIQKLTMPPSVRDIGLYILQNADPTCLTLEVYSINGTLPKMHGSPSEFGTLLVVHSAETNEKLCEFVILGKINKVFTEHGVDFTGYDEPFKRDFSSQGFSFKVGLRAAQVRLAGLGEADEEKREFFKEYISNAAFLITLNAVIQYPNPRTDADITEETYLDLITDDDLLGIIDQAAQMGKPEVTVRLLQYQHDKRSELNFRPLSLENLL